MTTASAGSGRPATARRRRRPAAGLFPAEHAYAVGLVQILTPIPERVRTSPEIDGRDDTNAGPGLNLEHEKHK
jgi:hypothetical protein